MADILAARDIMEGQYIELLHMAELIELDGDVFKQYRTADKATADAVRAIHALAVAVERQAKNEKD